MSNPRSYEIVDTDGENQDDIESNGNLNGATNTDTGMKNDSRNDNSDSSSADRIPPTISPDALLLPDGQIMNSKNTLQSFDDAALHSSPLRQELQRHVAAMATITSPLILPNGQIMDSKNTLQSFDELAERSSPHQQLQRRAAAMALVSSKKKSAETTGSDSSSADRIPPTISPEALLLPDGQIMDSKNTLQSFDDLAERSSPHQQLQRRAAAMALVSSKTKSAETEPIDTDHHHDQQIKSASSNNRNNDGLEVHPPGFNIDPHYPSDRTILAQATPVLSALIVPVPSVHVVEGEIYDPETSTPTESKATAPNNKYRMAFWVVAIVLVGVIIAGIGGYCGTENCGSSSSKSAPTTPLLQNAKSPTDAPISEGQLSAACNFLSLTNLTTCQATTRIYVDTKIVGNTVPNGIGLLTQLTSLSLSDKYLTGPIPTTLGALTLLTSLDLSSNQLTGPIPSTLGDLTQLKYLWLQYNQLIGPIPSTLGNLAQLTSFHLQGSNRLTGPIPSTLGNLTQLMSLSLSGNQLTGPIPSTLDDLTQLTALSLQANQLTGSIPSTLDILTQLTGLSLQANQLTGSIPSTLCSISGIKITIDCANVTCSCCFDGSRSPDLIACRST